MDQQEILGNLCYYDKRHPDYEKEEVVSLGLQSQRQVKKGGCSCDNCFYGRTKLAEMIISLQTLIATERVISAEPEDETATIMITLRQATLQVISVGPEKELLHEIRVAPKGTWDKLWEFIKSIKSLK
jgi:hypothetical protein